MAQNGKMTLLDIVQSILSNMDSFEVNSINETPESLQIATIVRDTYYETIASRNWANKKQLFQFNSSLTPDKPTHFKIPEDVKEVTWIRYNCRDVEDTRLQYREIKYLYPDEFLDILYARDSTDTTKYQVVTENDGVQLIIQTDKAPQYWTSFDDQYIIMDSFNSEVDSTLQNAKLSVYGVRNTKWEMTDTFVPDLPVEAFPLLLAEAESYAFVVLKGVSNQKAEQRAQRQNVWLSRKNWTAHGGVRYPDYGRKSGRRAVRKSPYLNKK